MARPVRHPTTGIYQFRKRVPDALRPLVGKREEKISLGTRDPSEAKEAHARVAATVEARWRQLAAGVQTLTQRQAEAIAGEIYRAMILDHEDNPGRVPEGLTRLVLEYRAQRTGKVRIYPMGSKPEQSEALLDRMDQRRQEDNARRVDDWLVAKGVLLTPESRRMVGQAVERAILQAREHLHRMDKGDYRPDPNGDRFPAVEVGNRKSTHGKRSPLTVFDDYAKEAEVAANTVKRWRPIIAAIEKEVPDIAGMTPEWVVEWKDRLIARGLSTRTVRDVNLACLKTVCAWAVTNKRMDENPVIGVSVRVRGKARTREKGFTDKEARMILRATLLPPPDGLSAHHRAARRWVPWLCAYTGARVGEMTQLRKADVKKKVERWLVHITPEAGTNKTRKARWVALHPALEQAGFLEFVRGSPDGPLFTDPGANRGGKTPPSERVSQRLGEWVREIGITDPEVQPNHGWRHRFKTLGRDHDIRPDALRYMQGHAPLGADEHYGDHKARALFREISKLPVLDLDPNEETRDEG